MVNQQSGAVDTIDVVIAEDSRIQAEMLRRRLVKEGFTARVAKNGVVALEEIKQRRPTIVISDIEMPEMDGYALCDAIKSDPELRNIPVILLSSLSGFRTRLVKFRSGQPQYLEPTTSIPIFPDAPGKALPIIVSMAVLAVFFGCC